MTESLIIHATLTVSGDAALLAAADGRIKTLLVQESFDGEFEEHHGDQALAYDFKVRGGIPFPVFAVVTQEFSALSVSAEWVNVGAGRKGRARIAGGRIVEHEETPMDRANAALPNRYVEAEVDGTLNLAFALVRLGPEQWAGYALRHDRDALFHLTCNAEAIELRATDGAPEWAWVWRLRNRDDTPPRRPGMQVAVDSALYGELDRLAREFVDEWIWLNEAPAEQTAIEREHYARSGDAVRDANLRAVKLRQLRGNDAAGQSLQHKSIHNTLDAESLWIRDVLLRCWAQS